MSSPQDSAQHRRIVAARATDSVDQTSRPDVVQVRGLRHLEAVGDGPAGPTSSSLFATNPVPIIVQTIEMSDPTTVTGPRT